MASIMLTTMVLVSALGADLQEFEQASRQSLSTQRPLVVLVGAEWCKACKTMQDSILPQVDKAGGLKNVIFVYVDFDQQRRLASKLTAGGAIPQLIRFEHTQAGWTNKRLVGAKSPGEVFSFINTGLAQKPAQLSKNATTNVHQ